MTIPQLADVTNGTSSPTFPPLLRLSGEAISTIGKRLQCRKVLMAMLANFGKRWRIVRRDQQSTWQISIARRHRGRDAPARLQSLLRA
jgi:hypothetical protein